MQPQRLQRCIGGTDGAAAGRLGVLLRQQDCALDQRQIAQQLAELLLHMQMHVRLHGLGERNDDADQELALGKTPHGGLVAGVVADAGLAEHRVAHLHVAVEEDAIPRDQHVVEHADGVGLLEARAERMIPGVLGAVVERLAADEFQALGGAGNAESENVAFRSLTDAGLRIDQEFVGGRTVGGEHLGAAHDQAVFGFLDHAEMGELVGLLMRSLGSVGLRIDDGVGGEQVALAAVLVVVADVVGKLRAALAEEVGVLGPGHQHGVEEIRRAAEQAEARFGPDLHRQPAFDEIGLAARDQERSAVGLAAVVVAMASWRRDARATPEGRRAMAIDCTGRANTGSAVTSSTRRPAIQTSRGVRRRPSMNSRPLRIAIPALPKARPLLIV